MATLLASALAIALLVLPTRAASRAAGHVDSLGDPLPAEAVQRLGTTRLRHPCVVQSLAFAPDGKTLASADAQGRVRTWDARTGRLRWELPADTGTHVAYAPDGKALATAGPNQPLRLWNPRNGRALRTLLATAGPPLAFAADGERLLCTDGSRSVLLIGAKTGKVVQRFNGLERQADAIALSPDGKTVAGGGMAMIAGDPSACHVILLWDVATGRMRLRIDDEPSYGVGGLMFTPDSRRLVSSTSHVCLWDAATGKWLATVDEKEARGRFAFGPAASWLVTGGDLCIWDVSGQQIVRVLAPGACDIGTVVVSPDGNTIAGTSSLDGRIRLWDVKTGREKPVGSGHVDEVGAVAFSPDGRFVGTASADGTTILLWNRATGAVLHTLGNGRSPEYQLWRPRIGSVVFSPDSRWLSAGCQRGVDFWDTATGKPVSGVCDPVERLSPRTVAFSPNGRLVAAAGWDPVVRLWDLSTRKVSRRIWPYGVHQTDPAWVPCVALSPDGKMVATASVLPPEKLVIGTPRGFQVQLWDIATGKQRMAFQPAAAPGCVAFSPDGRLLTTSATSHDPIQLWSVQTGRQVRQFAGWGEWRPWERVNPVAFSPDGQLVATGGQGNTVVVWELATGQPVRTLRGHTQPVEALAFAPDGRALISGSSDTTALIWPIVPSGQALVRSWGWGARTPDRLWAALADEPARAYPALWALAVAPRQAVPLLRRRLRPDAQLTHLDRLIMNLGARNYRIRQEATRQLGLLGDLAVPALRRGLAGQPDLEGRRRIEELLAALDWQVPQADLLRDLRAIQALAQMGTPAAQHLLKQLAQGAVGGPRTRAARTALKGLEEARR